jgi:hypothetical protein
MLISQKKAKLMLRREAGFSVALAGEKIQSLPKTVDGKREKVKQADVQRIIAEANKPSVIIPSETARPVRPFRRDLREKIQKYGELFNVTNPSKS